MKNQTGNGANGTFDLFSRRAGLTARRRSLTLGALMSQDTKMPTFETPRQLLEKLVSFPTISRESNLDLIAWVDTWLDERGIKAHRVYNADGTKAGLFAHVGPRLEGGVILSGHSDVVPVDGQNWTSDPFTLTERNGRLHGRGTCDMKGFVALALWAVAEAARHGVRRPLQLALSYDEEVGCLGAPPMIDRMREMLPKAEAVIVGEPSMMNTVTGHKGGFGYDVHVHGFEVHSSIMNTGVSAIMEAARLIDWANVTNAAIREAPVTDLAAPFDPPFTTVHVGQIGGGTAHNITAADCWFKLDFRVVPGETFERWREAFLTKVAAVEADMKAVHPETKIDLEECFAIPGLAPEKEGAAERLVRQLTGDNAIHVVSYGTEAGQFQQRGYSTVVCGPGDIAQAHQPDEFITLAQFNEGHGFVQRLLDRLAA